MPAVSGYADVKVQVTFVAALDETGAIQETWWSFTPDKVELKYTGQTSKNNPPDHLVWKLNAYTIDGKSLKGVRFPKAGGITVQWKYNDQPSRKDGRTYTLQVQNLNQGTDPDGPYPFIATVEFGGKPYSSPDPQIIFEPEDN